MPTIEERIAAGQELRRRGKLSAQQDAALGELERRYGVTPTPSQATGTPDFQNAGIDLVSEGGAQTLGQMKIPGLQDYIVQNMQEQRDADEARKALDARAAEEGRRAKREGQKGSMSNPGAYALSGMAGFNYGTEAEDKTYNEAGVASPSQAANINYLNAFTFGAPAFLNKDFREGLGLANNTQPGYSLAGQVAGSIVPGEALFGAGRFGYNTFAKPFVTKFLPKGGSAVARGTRLGAHGTEQLGAWTGQNVAYQATTGASVRAAQEGRAPTLTDVKEGAQAGATDLINVLGPTAGIALNRIFTAARSGGRTWTPQDRADYVSGMGGKSPGSGSVLDSRMLGGDVDQRAEKILIKMLGDAGYSRDDISRSLAAFDQLANETTDLPTLTARLKDVFIEQLGPEAENVILDFLQGAGVSRGSQAGRTMQRAADEDYGRIGQFLEDSGNARLGSGSRWDTMQSAEEEMRRLGNEQYEPLLNNADPIPESIGPVSSNLWQGPKPTEPQGLFGFIRGRGGIKERFGRFGEQGHYAGAVEQILGDVRIRPGLLNNKSGQTLDEMVTLAREAGFDIVDEEDLLRQLGDELTTGNKVFRIGEAEEWTAYQEFLRDIKNADDTVGMVPEAHPLREVLDFYAKSRFGGTLKEFSDAEMKQLDDWIKNNPRQAAHWMQSKANGKAQELRDAGRDSEANNWEKIRDNILAPLEESTPGYRETRLKFGDEFGIGRAATFGSRFFTKVHDTIGVQQLKKDYAALTPDQQAMARMSIRDEYLRLIGRHRRGAAPRLSQVDTDAALAGLEVVLGPEGAELANDIRYGSERLKRTQEVDNRAGPRSESNRQARQFADRAVSNPVSRTIGNALKALGGDAANTSAFGAFAPIHTVRSLAGGLGESMARGRQGKMDDVTALLLRDVGANPRPSMPGDVSPSAPRTSAPRGVGRDVSPSPRGVNALATNQSGSAQSGFTTDMASAAAGSVGGSVYGLQNDLNGDGVIDDKDAQIGALGGMVAGGLGSAGIRGANRIGRAPVGAPTQYRVRPGESGTFNVQSRAGGQRWERDNYPFATAKEAQAEIASRQSGNAPAWQVDDAIRAVRNSKTPQEFWDNVRIIPEGPRRDGVMRDMLKRAQSIEERGIIIDKFMGAASDWKQRERIARELLRNSPTDWQALRYAWPGEADPRIRNMEGVPSFMELVLDEAPALEQRVLSTPSPVEQALTESLGNLTDTLDSLQPRLATDNGTPVPQPDRPQAPSADIVPFRKPEPPKMSGINALAGPAGGAFTGGVMPLPSTGDPEQDRNNRLMAIAGGALAGSRTGRGAIRAAASGGIKTARQAMRAELPGSPEYERAVAKGLDMSTEARMQRARDMGFDTDNVAYRGLTREYDPAKAGRYQMFTSSPEDAGEYAGNGMYNGGNIVAAYLKKGNNLKIEGGRNNFNSIPIRNIPDGVSKFLHPSTRAAGLARTDEIAEAAQKAGYDSVSIKNVFDNAQNEIPLKPRSSSNNEISRRFNELLDDDELLAELEAGGFDFDQAAKFAPEIAPDIPRNYDPVTVDVIFDPANIRSVNAAFDPDMASSPMLTAGVGGRPPKLPKIMKDVPKGRPPAQGNPRLGTGNFLKEQVDNTRPPRLAEGPMTDTQIAARRKQEAVNPLLNQGLSADVIKQQTGIQTMVYKGKAFILPESTNSMTSEQVQRAFYDSFALPFEQRPGWVKQIIRATADEEGKALAAQGLWDSKNPVVLGTERTPMIRPGPNVPPENLNALARMPEPRR